MIEKLVQRHEYFIPEGDIGQYKAYNIIKEGFYGAYWEAYLLKWVYYKTPNPPLFEVSEIIRQRQTGSPYALDRWGLRFQTQVEFVEGEFVHIFISNSDDGAGRLFSAEVEMVDQKNNTVIFKNVRFEWGAGGGAVFVFNVIRHLLIYSGELRSVRADNFSISAILTNNFRRFLLEYNYSFSQNIPSDRVTSKPKTLEDYIVGYPSPTLPSTLTFLNKNQNIFYIESGCNVYLSYPTNFISFDIIKPTTGISLSGVRPIIQVYPTLVAFSDFVDIDIEPNGIDTVNNIASQNIPQQVIRFNSKLKIFTSNDTEWGELDFQGDEIDFLPHNSNKNNYASSIVAINGGTVELPNGVLNTTINQLSIKTNDLNLPFKYIVLWQTGDAVDLFNNQVNSYKDSTIGRVVFEVIKPYPQNGVYYSWVTPNTINILYTFNEKIKSNGGKFTVSLRFEESEDLVRDYTFLLDLSFTPDDLISNYFNVYPAERCLIGLYEIFRNHAYSYKISGIRRLLSIDYEILASTQLGYILVYKERLFDDDFIKNLDFQGNIGGSLVYTLEKERYGFPKIGVGSFLHDELPTTNQIFTIAYNATLDLANFSVAFFPKMLFRHFQSNLIFNTGDEIGQIFNKLNSNNSRLKLKFLYEDKSGIIKQQEFLYDTKYDFIYKFNKKTRYNPIALIDDSELSVSIIPNKVYIGGNVNFEVTVKQLNDISTKGNVLLVVIMHEGDSDGEVYAIYSIFDLLIGGSLYLEYPNTKMSTVAFTSSYSGIVYTLRVDIPLNKEGTWYCYAVFASDVSSLNISFPDPQDWYCAAGVVNEVRVFSKPSIVYNKIPETLCPKVLFFDQQKEFFAGDFDPLGSLVVNVLECPNGNTIQNLTKYTGSFIGGSLNYTEKCIKLDFNALGYSSDSILFTSISNIPDKWGYINMFFKGVVENSQVVGLNEEKGITVPLQFEANILEYNINQELYETYEHKTNIIHSTIKKILTLNTSVLTSWQYYLLNYLPLTNRVEVYIIDREHPLHGFLLDCILNDLSFERTDRFIRATITLEVRAIIKTRPYKT